MKGLKTAKPGDSGTKFVETIYKLFFNFRDTYQKKEWPRLDANEQIYKGDHWYDIKVKNESDPQPTTPVIFSTIENIRADLTDEYPEATIKPETPRDEVLAKILTEVVAQSVEACDYDREYDYLTHDLLVGGWMVQEVGWDRTLNSGLGGSFIRWVSNKNFMYDPYCVDIQDSRIVFKFDRLPETWFREHYPKQYKNMSDDIETVGQKHGEFSNTISPDGTDYLILIEAWIREYDGERHSIHMVKLAGGCVLENSYIAKPGGYFAHGMYPFIITPLYEQKGTSLGLGVVDMFKSAQQYSDKIDQIILKNALTAGHNRFMVMEDSVDVGDLKDYSKEVIVTNGPPSSVMSWIQDRPLPGHMLAFANQMRAYIKEESGSNDFSRGNVSSGVTAASAITALQEMSSKRSRMEARRVHYGFKQAIRMMIEVIRDFEVTPRILPITMDGEPTAIAIAGEMYRGLGDGLPIEFSVSIKPTRETRYSKLAHNQTLLEFMAMFQGQLDPLIMLEALDIPEREAILEKMRAAQNAGMNALQQQVAELSAMVEQMSGENVQLKDALTAAQVAISGEVPTSLPIDQSQGIMPDNMVLPT